MCGITGIINLDLNKIEEIVITNMTNAMAHRGPDGKGIFMDGNIALGHRRLSIIDVSEKGAQPMHSKTKNWTIVFNGCIYNFKELRQELINKGHTFNSTTDTEVIAEGLEAYGPVFFQRLNGMFAIGAFNHSNRKIYLSRDKFGIKPLYYWHNENTFLFASEIKAFMKHPAFKVDVDLSALNEYFTFQNLFSFRTLFKGVAMIPPANTIEIDKDFKQLIHNSWWDYDFSKTEESMSFEDAKDETLRLFQQAVKRQMVADVPVG
ncbi:MAG: asparagine synthetase B, partial [Bacteroidia bacterium]